MKISTSELKGAALDWAVAKIEGLNYPGADHNDDLYAPSTNWAQGGPIIECEGIAVFMGGYDKKPWTAASRDTPEWDRNPDAYGETPLIAAMRCYVYSKLGDEVDIPEELL